MPEFKIYASNHLRRHKKAKNNRTKFTYVCVSLIFPPSLASGKREIELKKANRSINSWKVSFVQRNFSLLPKITAQSKTGRTKDHIVDIEQMSELRKTPYWIQSECTSKPDMRAGHIKENNATKYVTRPRPKLSRPKILHFKRSVKNSD